MDADTSNPYSQSTNEPDEAVPQMHIKIYEKWPARFGRIWKFMANRCFMQKPNAHSNSQTESLVDRVGGNGYSLVTQLSVLNTPQPSYSEAVKDRSK